MKKIFYLAITLMLFIPINTFAMTIGAPSDSK